MILKWTLKRNYLYTLYISNWSVFHTISFLKENKKIKITPNMISHNCCFIMTYKHIFFTTQVNTWYNSQANLFLADTCSYPCAGQDRPLGLQKVEASRFSRQLAHEGGKVASLMHWRPRSPRRYPRYSVTGWVDTMATVWLEGLSQWKSQWPHWELNPQPSGLLQSASTNCTTIQGVPGGNDLTSGECSLGQTVPI